MPSDRTRAAAPLVVTGTGTISPAGLGPARLWEAMAAGKAFFGTGDGRGGRTPALPWPIAAVDRSEIDWPAGEPWVDNRKYANLAAHWAVAVALQALERSGRATAEDAPRGGTVIAVGSGGDELAEVIPRLAALAEHDPRPLAKLLYDEVPDYSYIRGIPSQMGQFVSMASGFRGSNVAAYGETGAGGLGALSLAVRLLESGELDRVLVVGVAPPMSVTAMAAFDQDEPFGTAAEAGRGPFDADRAGTLIGQGAAALMLERADTARARGVRPLAGLLACETIAAADRRTATAAALGSALDRAGRAPDLWWAHGAGSGPLDREECEAVLPAVGGVPATSSKGTVGNAFECSALIDAALTVETLGRGRLPQVGLLRRTDPALGPLDAVLDRPRTVPDATTALVTALNHGRGAAAAGALVLTRGESR
ncbi:beta-ketoacyl synthase N-terminal-like domain-containing protein [Kitasatospora sp. NPDC088346]|uniref:beta-ketoacyl synthase N-terminal-like domain-containing protein n=1 Tax=Kitasatospora sp. NPDC088346 TaxID=3364073 RepID=UPI0038066E40